MSSHLLLVSQSGGNVDSATVYIDIQPSGADVADIGDAATVPILITPSGVEIFERLDAATVYVDIQVDGGECYTTFSGNYLGEGEAVLEWSGDSVLNWSTSDQLEWSPGVPSVEGVTC